MPRRQHPGETQPCSILVLLVLSKLFQLLGYVSPGWYIEQTTTSSIRVNLWYVVTCHDDDCQSEALEENSITMKPYRVEASIALTAIVIAVTVVKQTRRKQTTNLRHIIMAYLAVGFLCVISGILSLSPAGRYAYIQHELVKNSSYSPIRFPYSLLLTGFGGVLACFAILSSVKLSYRLSKIQEQQNGNTQLNVGERSINTSTPAFNPPQSDYENPSFLPVQASDMQPEAPQFYQQNATNGVQMQVVAPPAYQPGSGSCMTEQGPNMGDPVPQTTTDTINKFIRDEPHDQHM